MLDRLAALGAASKGGWSDTHPAPKDRKAELKLPKQSLDPKAVELRTARFNEIIKKSEV
jgi:hypothetical protein